MSVDFEPSHLSGFAAGDPALEREFLETFLVQSRDYVDEAVALAERGDTCMWSEIVHKLGGSAASIGALNLAAACPHPRDYDPASVDKAWLGARSQDIAAAWEASRDAITVYIASLPPDSPVDYSL